jgi:hypothetical protein
MSTPTARYIITADDRSKAAIASVRKGFSDMERGVKASIKGVNTVLGIFVGVQLKQGFQQILKATEASAAGAKGFAQALNEVRTAAKDLLAAKSGLPEATKSMQELRDILKDPSLVAAADAFTSALIKGFAASAKQLGKLITTMRQAGVSRGVFDPAGNAEQVAALDGQIAREQSRLQSMQGRRGGMIKGEYGLGTAAERGPAAQAIRNNIARLQRERMAAAALPTFINPTIDIEDPDFLKNFGRSTGGGGGRGSSSSDIIQAGGGARDFNSMIPIDPQSLERSGRMWTDQFGDIEQVIKDIEKSMEDVSKTWGETTDEMSLYADQAARNMQGALADFLFDPFEDGLKGMARGFVDTLRRMVAEAAAASIFDSFKGAAGGTLGSILGSVFGGARAAGGPVSAGKAYLVGERGPELFAPGASGSIIPNGKMGGGIVINQSIDARGATADLVQALPAILAENNRRMYDELDRRWGLR